MRAVIVTLTMVVGWLAACPAAVAQARCLDTDSNTVFRVPHGLPEEDFLAGKMPSVDYGENNHATGVAWKDLPETEDFHAEQIGVYRGNAIWRGTWRQKGQPAGERPLFDLTVFGYSVPEGKKRVIQPFCIVTGDTLGTFDAYFESSPGEPFALRISETLSGTGRIWFVYRFLFTAGEASLRERSEGSRHSPQRIWRYNRAGKVVATRTVGQD